MKRRMNRRQFSAGVLAMGVTAVTARSARAVRGANERIRTGVIGCRNRGWQDAESFQKSGRFEIAAFCDCDAAMLDAGLKNLEGKLPATPRPERDFRRVLDDPSVDAVIIATPDHWHALMAVMALQAGKHVYLEKPVSFDIEDGKAIVAARQRHPKLAVAVGTQQRSGRHFVEAKQFIDAGGVGRIGFARAWFVSNRQVVPVVPDGDPPETLAYDMWLGPAPKRPYNVNRVHYNWHFFRDTGTGDAGNWGAHWLDVVRWYAELGLPRAAAGFGGQYIVRDAKEWPDTQTVLFDFGTMTVAWEMRHWSRFPINGMSGGAEIGGDKGTVVIDRGGWAFFPRDGKAEPVRHKGSELDVPHVTNFADCIGGAKPAADIVEGHRTAVLCHLANLATLFNRRIEFDAATETIRNDPEAARLAGREYRSPWKMPT